MSVNIKLGSNNITLEDEKLSFESATSAGTYVDFLYESGNKDVADLTEQDVSTKATARISAAERAKIIPGNIKDGVTILGVTGTHSGGQSYSITGAITNGTKSGAQSILPGQGANLIAKTIITPSQGYYLPVNVTVSNAQHTYDPSNGEVLIHTPTNNVVVTASCPDTPPLAKGDVFITPYTSSASTSDQSTWSKMLILEKSDNILTVVPLTSGYYDASTGTTKSGCPQFIECNSYASDQGYNTYFDDYDAYRSSNPYKYLSDSSSWEVHSAFSSALQSSFTTITQNMYEKDNGQICPDVSSAMMWTESHPTFSSARMFDIADLVNFYSSNPLSDATLTRFFFKNAYIEGMSNFVMIWTPSFYYDTDSGQTKMWTVRPGSYDSYSGSTYDASWDYYEPYTTYYDTTRGFVPVVSLNLNNLQYWARTNENWLNP